MNITNDTVAIVTGASSGIGASLAELLGKEGAKVAIIARREDRLHEVAQKVQAAGGVPLVIIADVGNPEQAKQAVQKTIDTFGKVDILVNNAGRGNRAIVEDTTPETLQNIFDVNVFSLWYMTGAVLPLMKQQKSGHIINIASIVGKLAYPCNSAYVAAKHACVGFTAGLRAELVGTGVEATVVCPAGVKTEWAGATEGGPIGQIFVEAFPLAKQYCEENNLPLPPASSLLTSEDVAQQIVDIIRNGQQNDYFTHEGTAQQAVLVATDRAAFEQAAMPLYKGMMEVYLQHHPRA